MSVHTETATLGGGCFWCLEAVFASLKGVQKVVSGYAGGSVKNPAYREVCEGTTGHAEVVQVTFNADLIHYEDLLEIFFNLHDPTTLNRQGNDAGTQYRSAIFHHLPEQKCPIQSRRKYPNRECGLLWCHLRGSLYQWQRRRALLRA